MFHRKGHIYSSYIYIYIYIYIYNVCAQPRKLRLCHFLREVHMWRSHTATHTAIHAATHTATQNGVLQCVLQRVLHHFLREVHIQIMYIIINTSFFEKDECVAQCGCTAERAQALPFVLFISYGVPTIRSLLKITGLFCRI